MEEKNIGKYTTFAYYLLMYRPLIKYYPECLVTIVTGNIVNTSEKLENVLVIKSVKLEISFESWLEKGLMVIVISS